MKALTLRSAALTGTMTAMTRNRPQVLPTSALPVTASVFAAFALSLAADTTPWQGTSSQAQAAPSDLTSRCETFGRRDAGRGGG
jgi:hypothetical protein